MATINGTTGIDTLNGTTLDDIIKGLAGNDIIFGDAGNDMIDGGAGDDQMSGGAGNDIFIVDSIGDNVIENVGEGTDTVRASISYTLGANIENLLLTGLAAINGTGNGGANSLVGNGAVNILSGLDGNDVLKGMAGDDTLNGGIGNDTLDGGVGVDQMNGGAGNDTYLVDNAGDLITESLNEGIDTVQASVTATLSANVERLLLIGSAAINGTGNGDANSLVGNGAANILSGLDGNDSLKGMAGDDTLNGGLGNDTLDGGLGVDHMNGGAGNDTYLVDNAGDLITENLNEGIDTVQASVTATLSANVEKLLLSGLAAINGTGNGDANTLTGNSAVNVLSGLDGNDTLYGMVGDDTLNGGLGNDVLDGGLGADHMNGGAGNDTYFVDNAGDLITENLNEGNDTVNTGLTWTLGANIENLLLTGTGIADGTGNIGSNALTGNDAVNRLIGLAGNDTLSGLAGDDILVGGSGQDAMTGGLGLDHFVFDDGDFSSRTSFGADRIVDFVPGEKIDLNLVDAVNSPSGHDKPGDQNFFFIGTNNFHNHTGQEIRYSIVGGNTFVYGSVNGDTTADFCIQIDGVHTLTASDFIL